jgi:hypothetical protein
MKINVAQAVVLLLVAMSVFVGVQMYVNSVDVSGVPYAGYIQAVFSTGAMTVVVTLLVNVGGYIENAVGANADVKYEASKLGATFARYAVYMAIITTTIIGLTQGTPFAPYAAEIAAGLSLAADLLKRSIQKVIAGPQPAATPPPDPPAAAAPS